MLSMTSGSSTVDIRDLVTALLRYEPLAARQWILDFARSSTRWADVPKPDVASPEELSLAAAVVEMMAERAGDAAPSWTQTVSASPRRIFLVRAAERMPRLRSMCEEQGPEPLRRRQFLAPPDFLTYA